MRPCEWLCHLPEMRVGRSTGKWTVSLGITSSPYWTFGGASTPCVLVNNLVIWWNLALDVYTMVVYVLQKALLDSQHQKSFSMIGCSLAQQLQRMKNCGHENVHIVTTKNISWIQMSSHSNWIVHTVFLEPLVNSLLPLKQRTQNVDFGVMKA